MITQTTPRRKSIRLKGYDYSWSGAYFVTICTHRRETSLGQISNGVMTMSPIGKSAERCWKEIPVHFPSVETEYYVIMPNHVHGIIVINDDEPRGDVRAIHPRRDVQLNVPTKDFHSKISPKRGTLGVIVRTYKAAVTTWCRNNGFPDFRWQDRFHDHIIRDEQSFSRICEYIRTNPERWHLDKENNAKTDTDSFEKWLDSGGSEILRAKRTAK